MKIFFLIFVLLLSGGSYFLRESSLDYYLAVMMLLLSTALIPFVFKKYFYYLDSYLIVIFTVAILYVVKALYDGRDLQIVTMQSLIFTMPIISYMFRGIGIRLNSKSISQFLCVIVAAKLIFMAANADIIIESLQNSGDRERFHDYTSISLALVISGLFWSKSITGKRERLFLLAGLLIFVALAAHRSLYLALIFQGIVYFLSSSGRSALSNKMRTALFLCISVGGILFTSFGRHIVSLTLDSVEGVDGNTNFRKELSSQVINNSFDKILGVGFGDEYGFGLDSWGEIVYYALHHDSFLTYLYFIGWVPFLLICVFFIFILNNSRKEIGPAQGFSLALLGMGCFSIFNVFLEHPLYGMVFWVTYAIYVGISLADKHCDQRIYV